MNLKRTDFLTCQCEDSNLPVALADFYHSSISSWPTSDCMDQDRTSLETTSIVRKAAAVMESAHDTHRLDNIKPEQHDD
jgi:hypothetical protein